MSLHTILTKLIDQCQTVLSDLEPLSKQQQNTPLALQILDTNLPHQLNRLANLCDILADSVLQYEEQTIPVDDTNNPDE
jgi:hypothetical protein